VKSFINGVALSRDGSTLLVSDWDGGSNAIHTLRAVDGSPLWVIGGGCDGSLRLKRPRQVSVFSVAGAFVRHVGVGSLRYPTGVACSAFDELVVTDWNNKRVVMFSASGEMLTTMVGGAFTGVAIHGGTVFAQTYSGDKCVVFT
jgi:hypothetical protein